tara:strand:+ start:36 stop:1187 length:1152 start_codon:yes stop_codon:yes gene_type:complete
MKKIKFTTAGESHGELLLGIIEGIPSNLEITEEYIYKQLKRRQMGLGRGKRMKIESDKPHICSGVRLGKTLGSPIGLIIKNNDWDNWKKKMNVNFTDKPIRKITVPRPGHADLAGAMKFDFDDIRNVIERSSARETAMRVAVGSICRKLLEQYNIKVGSYVTSIYKYKDNSDYNYLKVNDINKQADKSDVRCLNKTIEKKMINAIKDAQKKGDSLGGSFQVHVSGVPYGLGGYTSWNEKLNANLGKAILSINGIKSFDIGLGELSEQKLGSELHDEIQYNQTFERTTNNCGGIEGGMSNGQRIILSATMKPIPTLIKPLKSVDMNTKEAVLAHKERTDSCSVPAASIIAESMACIIICNALLEKFGGDSMQQLTSHIESSAKY